MSIEVQKTWDDIFKEYIEDVPTWSLAFPYQSFENWLQENYEAPQIKNNLK